MRALGRVLLAGALGVEAFLALGLGALLLISGAEPGPVVLALAVGVALVPAAALVLVPALRRRHPRSARAVLLVAVLAHVAVAVAYGADAAAELRPARRVGVDAGAIAVALGVAALALGLAALVARLVPTSRGRRLRAGSMVALALPTAAVAVALAALGAAGARASGLDCRLFTFGPGSWPANRGEFVDARLAASLSRCRTLQGLTRAQVERRLGRSGEGEDRERALYWYAPDGASLAVTLNRSGRVAATRAEAGGD